MLDSTNDVACTSTQALGSWFSYILLLLFDASPGERAMRQRWCVKQFEATQESPSHRMLRTQAFVRPAPRAHTLMQTAQAEMYS